MQVTAGDTACSVKEPLGLRQYYRYYDTENILLKYRNKILILTCRLSVHKIIGKCEILQTYHKSEEILTFYPVHFCKFKGFVAIFDEHVWLIPFPVESRFNWGNTRKHLIRVFQNRNGFALAGCQTEKSATDSSLLSSPLPCLLNQLLNGGNSCYGYLW